MAEKKFEPTLERLRKSYRMGKSKRSQLFASAVLSLIVVFGIGSYLRINWVRIQLLVECLWSQQFTKSGKCVRTVVLEFHYFIVALLGVMLCSTILLQAFQVGLHWLPVRILPDMKRISFIEGFSRVGASLQRVPAEIAKILIAALVGVVLLYQVFQQALRTQYIQPFSVEYVYRLFLLAAGVLVIFGIYDIFVQRKRFREQVYMDHQEMRRELRESEGDPYLKAQRTSLQRALAREDLIRQIRRTKVLIVERSRGET